MSASIQHSFTANDSYESDHRAVLCNPVPVNHPDETFIDLGDYCMKFNTVVVMENLFESIRIDSHCRIVMKVYVGLV